MNLMIRVPPTANRMYATGKKRTPSGKLVVIRRRSDEYNEWITRATAELVSTHVLKTVRFPRVVIWCPRNKRRDLDNHVKPILDLLQRLKVLENDRQIEEIIVRWAEPEKYAWAKDYCTVEVHQWA